MNYDRLDAIVNSYRDEILETLSRWIPVPSVAGARTAENAPFGAENRRMLEMALEDCRKLGFEVDDVDGFAMSAQMGRGEETMGILCHLDVVPAGDGWTHNPWCAEIEDGKLYGRGVADDKGAAVLTMFAMKAVREAGIELKDGVRLICGCSEETGMGDKNYYASKRKMPDYGFSPDAEFPVINIEKGGVGLTIGQITGGEEGAKIPVYELYGGERQNVVPGKAWARLGVTDREAFEKALDEIRKETGFELISEYKENGECLLTAIGQSAHASMPHLGKNAAGMLLIALSKLEAGGGSREAIKCLAEKIGIEGDGKSLGIACADEESGALTCNMGIMRYDQNFLYVTCDCRYPICADETLICGNAVRAVSPYRMFVRFNGSHQPHHIPAGHKIVKGLLKAYHEVTGLEPYTIAIGGGTYSRCMPNTVAFGLNFPGDTDMCHMPDEYMDIEKMMLSARVIARAIAELAGKHE